MAAMSLMKQLLNTNIYSTLVLYTMRMINMRSLKKLLTDKLRKFSPDSPCTVYLLYSVHIVRVYVQYNVNSQQHKDMGIKVKKKKHSSN